MIYHDTVDGCEILHQLIGGKHPIIYRVSTNRIAAECGGVGSGAAHWAERLVWSWWLREMGV